ncbi:hypothetical protein [uncultured Clostridium sp.]|jgi:cell division protein FtsL|uniref:hypothetical protein n=1 Tax=uncultured Clostridium sp. TaxID=59620 RepID=UPI00260394D0|nr:hypothetical protein [uncultured Clostridium sp.]
MFSDKYKKDNEKINLDDSFKEELAKNMKKGDFKVKRNNKNFKAIIGVAAAMAIVVGGYFISQDTSKGKIGGDIASSNEEIKEEKAPMGGDMSGGNTGETSMMSYLRYDGKDYRYVFHNINAKNIDSIKGEKLGTTILGKMDEEFSSHAKDVEIYTVKGYEDKSVLLGVLKTETDTIIDIYSYYDDNAIKTGNDLVSKMKIEGNIKAVKTSENNGMGEYIEKDIANEINSLISELKIAKNMLDDKEFMDSLYGENASEFKAIEIELNDGIIRAFDFYKSGYLFIDGYVFDLENKEKVLEIYNAI